MARSKSGAAAQTSIFKLLEPHEPHVTEAIPEWVTGAVVDRSGIAAYMHLIRSTDDPERADIRLLPAELRDRGAEWLRSLLRSPAADWHAPLVALLGDGEPRTFNRIAVELLDKTADVLLESPPEAALWALVASGQVEHTLRSPVFFRLARAAQ